MERYDIAIIGTGPAGVSAAITAKVRGKRLILFGAKAMSDKVEKAHSILNYPGLPNRTTPVCRILMVPSWPRRSQTTWKAWTFPSPKSR